MQYSHKRFTINIVLLNFLHREICLAWQQNKNTTEIVVVVSVLITLQSVHLDFSEN